MVIKLFLVGIDMVDKEGARRECRFVEGTFMKYIGMFELDIVEFEGCLCDTPHNDSSWKPAVIALTVYKVIPVDRDMIERVTAWQRGRRVCERARRN